MFDHFAQLLSQLCQFPISPGRPGQRVEQPKSKSTQPRFARRCVTHRDLMEKLPTLAIPNTGSNPRHVGFRKISELDGVTTFDYITFPGVPFVTTNPDGTREVFNSPVSHLNLCYSAAICRNCVTLIKMYHVINAF